jgi:hypothetical protein
MSESKVNEREAFTYWYSNYVWIQTGENCLHLFYVALDNFLILHFCSLKKHTRLHFVCLTQIYEYLMSLSLSVADK